MLCTVGLALLSLGVGLYRCFDRRQVSAAQSSALLGLAGFREQLGHAWQIQVMLSFIAFVFRYSVKSFSPHDLKRNSQYHHPDSLVISTKLDH